MPPLTWIERAGGRKFVLSVFGMSAGFVLAVTGLVLVVHAPAVAASIAEIVGQYSVVIGVALSIFGGANALVTWKHGGPPATVTETESTERIRETGAFPATTTRTETAKVSTPMAPATPQPPGE